MKLRRAAWCFIGFAAVLIHAAEPTARIRPRVWATPIINATMANCYGVSDDLFRCEQPGKNDIADLRALGIRSILNLRQYHTDSDSLERAGFALYLHRMEAGKIVADDLVAVPDDAIVAAMRGLIAHAGLIVEPAGVVGIAALLSAPHGSFGQRVGTILCGGNVTSVQLSAWGVLRPSVG